MITTAQIIQEILKREPFTEHFLSQNLLNLTQYAKQIQPEIEKITLKKIQLGAIVTSLSRMRKQIKSKFEISFKVNDVALKYPLTEITFESDPEQVKLIVKLYKQLLKYKNNFLNIISGNTETSIFVNSQYTPQVLQTFLPTKPVVIIENLAAISLKFSPKYIFTVGTTYAILKALTWEGINLVEIISTYTEATLIVRKQDSQKAFEVLTKVFID